jgi:hypothetical protein
MAFTLLARELARSPAVCTSVSLPVVADNYADSKYPEKAYGTRPILYVGNSYDRSQDIWGQERIYLKFDVKQLSSATFILSATVKLFIFYAPKVELATEIWMVKEDWDERNQTWVNQPGCLETEAPQVTIGPEGNRWVEWVATELVRTWVSNPDRNFGAMIRAVSEERIGDNSAGAWSRECGIAGAEPQLEITCISTAELVASTLLPLAVTMIIIVVILGRTFRSAGQRSRRQQSRSEGSLRSNKSKEQHTNIRS